MGRLAFYYFRWHYSTALTDLLRLWRNFLWFFYNFFSIGTLARTLFAPWRRLTVEYEEGFDPERFFSTLAGNLIVRLVGAVLRSILIVLGALMLCVTLLAGGVLFLAWLIAPLLVPLMIVAGALFLIAA